MNPDIKVKIERYCAFQERSHLEVRNKLVQLGARGDDLELFIGHLLEFNFLNELRFAEAYTSGKMRIKAWGRNKIKTGLRAKGVNDNVIRLAFKEIDEEEEREILAKRVMTHSDGKDLTDYKVRHKVFNYFYGRGWDTSLINETLNNYVEDIS